MTQHTSKRTWPRVRFGDVVRLYKERSADPEADGIERYVGIEHIEPEDLRIREWGLVEEGTSFTRRFEPGHVLFVKRRAYQRKVAVADFAGVCSGDIYVLEPKDDRLLPELLPYICQTDAFFAHAVNTSAGSLSPRTNWKRLSQYEFALPPLAEQRRAVKVLEALEVTIANLENAITSSSLVEIACVDSFFTKCKERGDKTVLLKKVCQGKLSYGINASAVEFSPGLPRFLRITDIDDDGNLLDDDIVSVHVDDPESYAVQAGDLLFARTGNTVGKVYLATGKEENCVFAGYLIKAHPNREIVLPAFLFAFTRSSFYKVWIQQTVRVGAQPNINSKEYSNLPLWVPSFSEQEKLVQIVESIRENRESLTQRRLDTKEVEAEFVNRILSGGSL